MGEQSTTQALGDAPTPDHITLLLKHHKSTTLLSVLPTQSFTEIKPLLLAALRSRHVDVLPNTETPLPSDPEDIEFGALADRKDPSRGWVPLEIKEQDVTDTKGVKRKVGGKRSVLNDSPAGAGLVDGSWLAYRIKTIRPQDDGVSSPGDVIDIDDPGWDVVLPSFEDE